MYQAFGLNIKSEVSLSGLIPGMEPEDVCISYGQVKKPWPAGAEQRHMYVREHEGDVYIVWHTEAGVEQRISVRSGKDIVVDADEIASHAVIKQAIQGLGLGLLLHQRQQYVLHASAIAIKGEAIVFIGFKGAGKSTTASALFAKGHSMVTDDLLAVQLPKDELRAYALPGIPTFKLWPDSVEASLREDPEQLPRVFNKEEKRLRTLKHGFIRSALPIRCIYVLEYNDTQMTSPLISPLSGTNACLELIRHSYGVRMLGAGGRNKTHFLQTIELLKRVPLFRLSRSKSLDGIPVLVQCIEEHDI